MFLIYFFLFKEFEAHVEKQPLILCWILNIFYLLLLLLIINFLKTIGTFCWGSHTKVHIFLFLQALSLKKMSVQKSPCSSLFSLTTFNSSSKLDLSIAQNPLLLLISVTWLVILHIKKKKKKKHAPEACILFCVLRSFLVIVVKYNEIDFLQCERNWQKAKKRFLKWPYL